MAEMAVLTKKEILEKIKSGQLAFTPPLDKFQLQGVSVDFRLGFTFLVPRLWQRKDEGRAALEFDQKAKEKGRFEAIELEPGQYFEILPREFLIVSTLEKIKLPNDIMGILYPRSTINRRGLSVDLSGVIDAGYEGFLVIPVRNNTSTQIIRLYPGERFCQIVFHQLASSAPRSKSRYRDKDVVVGVLKEKFTQEVRLIRKGKLKELKEKFKLV